MEMHPVVESLLRNAAPRTATPLEGRERVTETAFAFALLAATVAMTLALPAGGGELGWQAAALVLLCAMAGRVRFSVGGDTTTAEQLALVPMLLLLPPAQVPLLVATALALRRVPEYVRGRTHPDRLILAVADAWSSVAPALVVALAAPGPPSLDHWPVYLAAFAAQLVADAGVSVVREWAAFGTPPALQLRMMAIIAAVDSALAPIGLMTAVLAYEQPAALVLGTPLLAVIAALAHERERRIEHALALSDAYRGSAILMGEMLEADDPYTGGEHSKGVVALALAVGRRLELDARDQRNLEFGALLHDIGKLKVPDELLNKPGPLTPAEWDVMRRHPVDGQEMLERIGGVLADVGLTVRSHHERWDGGGYPDGLAGEAIPLNARIIAACDAYSAMTTNRSYRAGRPVAEAVAELRTCAGAQFDPRVVDALAAVVEAEAPAPLAAALAA
ncbi:MAG TPA: HD-GYP domain-containing protein [Solirubrobacteraceae bacterium]|jgi:putative nucleotidyltransferase with HDIG domain|nr:HD-GYP domain-containing protein [Solirubrobacteraceae bacterium]